MIIKKTYKFCLLPTTQNLQLFCRFAGACRWTFNQGLAARIEKWEKDKKPLSLFDQNKHLTFLKKTRRDIVAKRYSLTSFTTSITRS